MKVRCCKCNKVGWLVSRNLSPRRRRKYFYVEHYELGKRFWHYIPLEKVNTLEKIIEASKLKLRSPTDPWGEIPPPYGELVKEYCSALEKHFGENLVSICLFGSVARGDPEPGDIDVLVVAEDIPPDLGSRVRETMYIHENLEKSNAYLSLEKSGKSCLISTLFFTSAEIKGHPPILLDMIEDGIILYDKGGFLKGELELVLKRLRELRAKKVVAEEGHYWILKPDIKPSEVVEI